MVRVNDRYPRDDDDDDDLGLNFGPTDDDLENLMLEEFDESQVVRPDRDRAPLDLAGRIALWSIALATASIALALTCCAVAVASRVLAWGYKSWE